jgi:peptidoglycan-associated lipoprotein
LNTLKQKTEKKMIKKYLALMIVGLFVVACEAPIDPNASNNDSSVTDGSDSAGNGNGGSADAGYGGGELAPGVPDTVYFSLDSSAIEGEAARVLAKQAEYLASSPMVNLTIEGHADERGTREYNLALGERRAAAVKQYLVSQGVDASRLDTISYGKERPVAVGSDEESWSKNRRGVSVKK